MFQKSRDSPQSSYPRASLSLSHSLLRFFPNSPHSHTPKSRLPVHNNHTGEPPLERRTTGQAPGTSHQPPRVEDEERFAETTEEQYREKKMMICSTCSELHAQRKLVFGQGGSTVAMSLQLWQTSVVFPRRIRDNSERTTLQFVKLPNTARTCRPTKLCFSMQHRLNSEVLSEVNRDAWRIGDKDGVIIVDHGSRREQSNLMLNDLVTMFKRRTGYSIVEPAHMELAKPSISDAFNHCIQQGANRIIISPFFLFPGRHWQEDIPSLARDAALEHPGVPYIVTAPLGLHELMVDIIQDRIGFCLRHAAGREDECSVCAGTGKCQLLSNGTSSLS